MKRYTRTKSGEMVESLNGGWVQYHHVESLTEALKLLMSAAENVGGEHVIGLMDLDNAIKFAEIKITKALGETK